jgi:membrane-associated phospholipid phosphatase
LIALVPVYDVIALSTPGRRLVGLELALDRAVPFQPKWELIYGSLYVFLFLPLFVVGGERLFRRTIYAYLAVLLVGYAGFLAMPAVGPRPPVFPGDGFIAWLLGINFALDPPYNCFPSLHVGEAVVAAVACYRVHRGVGVVTGLWAALIAVSTLFIKQHYVVDVVAGVLVGGAACVLFLRTAQMDVPEPDRRRAPVRALGAVATYAAWVAGLAVGYWQSHI